MNTNPNAVKVLCYGDSNTWGQKPDKTGRYAANVRWTGVLQEQLGDGYYIIEEGLGSRTTNLEYAKKPGRNGKTYFVPCLQSHTPLDIVVIMLGTNDLKIEYGRTAQDVAQALNGLVNDVREYSQDNAGATPKIVLVSPIHIDITAPMFTNYYTGIYDEHSAQESHALAGAILELATNNDCYFVDAASVSRPGIDGIHCDEESELPLAKLLHAKILEITQ